MRKKTMEGLEVVSSASKEDRFYILPTTMLKMEGVELQQQEEKAWTRQELEDICKVANLSIVLVVEADCMEVVLELPDPLVAVAVVVLLLSDLVLFKVLKTFARVGAWLQGDPS